MATPPQLEPRSYPVCGLSIGAEVTLEDYLKWVANVARHLAPGYPPRSTIDGPTIHASTFMKTYRLVSLPWADPKENSLHCPRELLEVKITITEEMCEYIHKDKVVRHWEEDKITWVVMDTVLRLLHYAVNAALEQGPSGWRMDVKMPTSLQVSGFQRRAEIDCAMANTGRMEDTERRNVELIPRAGIVMKGIASTDNPVWKALRGESAVLPYGELRDLVRQVGQHSAALITLAEGEGPSERLMGLSIAPTRFFFLRFTKDGEQVFVSQDAMADEDGSNGNHNVQSVRTWARYCDILAWWIFVQKVHLMPGFRQKALKKCPKALEHAEKLLSASVGERLSSKLNHALLALYAVMWSFSTTILLSLVPLHMVIRMANKITAGPGEEAFCLLHR
ncbi:hypothetical protein MD484_g7285, partial [Candolleomyces efflorescens]